MGTERPGAPSTQVPSHTVLSARRTPAQNTKVVIGTAEPQPQGLRSFPDGRLRRKARSRRLLRLLQWAGRSFSEAGWARNARSGRGESHPALLVFRSTRPHQRARNRLQSHLTRRPAPVCGERPPSPRPGLPRTRPLTLRAMAERGPSRRQESGHSLSAGRVALQRPRRSARRPAPFLDSEHVRGARTC